MKAVNTKQKLTSFNGEEVKDREGNPFLLGDQVANALATSKANPVRSWQLGKAFSTEKEVDLKAEDVVFIKKALEEAVENRILTAMIAGQIIDELDSKDSPKAKK